MNNELRPTSYSNSMRKTTVSNPWVNVPKCSFVSSFFLESSHTHKHTHTHTHTLAIYHTYILTFQLAMVNRSTHLLTHRFIVKVTLLHMVIKALQWTMQLSRISCSTVMITLQNLPQGIAVKNDSKMAANYEKVRLAGQ